MSSYKDRKKLTTKEAKTQLDNAEICIQNEQEMFLWYNNILKENKNIIDNMIIQMFQEERGVEYYLKKIIYGNI